MPEFASTASSFGNLQRLIASAWPSCGLADFHKEERQRAAAAKAVSRGKMTFGDALAAYNSNERTIPISSPEPRNMTPFASRPYWNHGRNWKRRMSARFPLRIANPGAITMRPIPVRLLTTTPLAYCAVFSRLPLMQALGTTIRHWRQNGSRSIPKSKSSCLNPGSLISWSK